MIVTEQEAAVKLCPHMPAVRKRVAPNGELSQQFILVTDTCHGSRCMMWRWLDRMRGGTVLLVKSESYGGNEYQITEDLTSRRGYCGMAWRPETS